MAAAKKKAVAKSWLKRPGGCYLGKCHDGAAVEIKPKCSCEGARGAWRVQDPDGSLLYIDPPTQLQKDIWLTTGTEYNPHRENADKEERIKALRWACSGCCTVQMP
jgi:hypothetical protein